MSGRHFSLEGIEDGLLLRDLKSTNGTFVNGQRVTEAKIKPGDVIGAGSLEFRLSLLTSSPAVAATTVLPVLDSSATESAESSPILRYLRSLGVPVYCLLDAACDQKIVMMLGAAKERVQCLYDGQSAVDLASWAPYLVELPFQSVLGATLFTEGWGKGWASYFVSQYPFEELRHHFRKYLLVRMDDSSDAYFRFYDPRVLREFLSTSTRTEVWEFFGPVEKWVVESKSAGIMLQFSHNYGTLKTDSIMVDTLP